MKSMPSRFETACDPDFLRPGLEYAIERATGERADIVDLEVPRAFPRKDGGLTLELRARFRSEGSSETRSLRLGGHLLGPAERWPGYVTAHASKVLCFEALRFVVPLFPFDATLRLLPQLLDSERAPGILRRAGVPGLEDASALVPEVLGYRLERRCVLRHLPVTRSKRAAGPALVTKALRPGRTASLQSAIRALATAGATGLAPNTRTLDIGRGLHVTEEVPGRVLHDLDPSREYASGCEAAGHALARLHTLPREDLPQRSVEDALRALERLVDLASAILPARSMELHTTLHAVLAKRPADPEARARTAVHGDFYDKQVLLSAGHAVVLDWDGLACGDPAQDHGNFTAHIALRAAQAPEHAAQIELGAAAFRRGCRSCGSEYLARVRWWEAAALVRLAALYGLRRRWRHLVPVLLERATRSLEQQSRVAMLLMLLVMTTAAARLPQAWTRELVSKGSLLGSSSQRVAPVVTLVESRSVR